MSSQSQAGRFGATSDIDLAVCHLDVELRYPPGAAARKGWTVRPLRRYTSWVQNVDILRWRGETLLLVLAYIGETCVRLNR